MIYAQIAYLYEGAVGLTEYAIIYEDLCWGKFMTIVLAWSNKAFVLYSWWIDSQVSYHIWNSETPAFLSVKF
jgi:hypothetical protein